MVNKIRLVAGHFKRRTTCFFCETKHSTAIKTVRLHNLETIKTFPISEYLYFINNMLFMCDMCFSYFSNDLKMKITINVLKNFGHPDIENEIMMNKCSSFCKRVVRNMKSGISHDKKMEMITSYCKKNNMCISLFTDDKILELSKKEYVTSDIFQIPGTAIEKCTDPDKYIKYSQIVTKTLFDFKMSDEIQKKLLHVKRMKKGLFKNTLEEYGKKDEMIDKVKKDKKRKDD
jgi:hypothetical protein